MRTLAFRTDAIEASVSAGVPLVLEHGFGTPPNGWLVIWADTYVSFRVQDPAADARRTLVLIPDADANVRLVLV